MRPLGNATVLHVAGEVDISNVDAFQTALEEAKASRKPTVIVSYEHATYVDSTTINALIRYAQAFSEEGVRLTVVVPRDSKCTRIFNLVGLHHLVHVAESVDSAAAQV